jgi:hypothetical protein
MPNEIEQCDCGLPADRSCANCEELECETCAAERGEGDHDCHQGWGEP